MLLHKMAVIDLKPYSDFKSCNFNNININIYIFAKAGEIY
ncbi:hypothetical protein ES703_112574 [subsurface metagenome]